MPREAVLFRVTCENMVTLDVLVDRNPVHTDQWDWHIYRRENLSVVSVMRHGRRLSSFDEAWAGCAESLLALVREQTN